MKTYPKRTVLGLALFIGQAFLYNAILFGYATLLEHFLRRRHRRCAVLPGRVRGRQSARADHPRAAVRQRRPQADDRGDLHPLGRAVADHGLHVRSASAERDHATIAWTVVFFFASAGVSAAYLTVSEIFPLETRALAIALFYAVGTGIGGIIGPQLFGRLVPTGNTSDVFLALSIGAILMIVGGLVEIVYGVKAERRGLEGIAAPLTAVRARRAAACSAQRRRPPVGAQGPPSRTLSATASRRVARGARRPTRTPPPRPHRAAPAR